MVQTKLKDEYWKTAENGSKLETVLQIYDISNNIYFLMYISFYWNDSGLT